MRLMAWIITLYLPLWHNSGLMSCMGYQGGGVSDSNGY